MILKRLILVLLAAFLVMGCVGAVSADDTPINNVAISVTTPTTDGTPETSLTWDHATGTISWSPSATKFAPGIAYFATITVSASDGYNFSDSVGVTFNSAQVTPTILTNKSFTVSHTFVATAEITLNTIDLTLEAPATGNTSGTPSSDTTGVGTPSVSWSPSATTFNANEVYTATITVPAATGYLFGDSPTVKVNNMNGEKITVAADKKSLTAECSFPETTPIEISSPIALTLTPPVTGNSPTSPSSTTTGVGTPTIVWSPTVGTFVEGQVYSANITIPVAPTNYNFSSSPTVTLNGVDVSSDIISKTNAQIILNHTFAATALKTRIDSVIITGVTAPVYGSYPVTSAASSTTGISSVSVSWNPTVSSTFAADTTYNATIIAQITDSRFAFNTSTPSVSLNGAPASTANVTRNSDTQITITYRFPETESKILPTITLSANVTSGTIPLPVKFTYTITNATSKSWTYGDSSTATLSSSGTLNHTYTTPGTYTANLTATNGNGTVYKNITITVKKAQLVAGFQVSALSGTAPLTVKFTDSSVGKVTSRSWSFGDGTSDTIQNPTHTFTSPGKYIVVLTISDGVDSDHTERTITVNPPVTITPTQTAGVKSLTTTSAGTGNMSEIPHPFDIIKEFIHLFYSILDPANYLFAVNDSKNTS